MIELLNRNVDAGLAAALVVRLAKSSRLARAVVVLFDGLAEPDLLPLFEGSSVDGHPAAVIDASCDDPAGGLALAAATLVFRVSTAVAGRLDVAGPLVTILARWLPTAHSQQGDMRVAVQEAVGNAVMHGNLALDGGLRATREGLVKFGQDMNRRLDDPRYGALPVTLTARWADGRVMISVEDRGAGFDPEAREGRGGGYSGRGMALIRSYSRTASYSDGGRRVSMMFCEAP